MHKLSPYLAGHIRTLYSSGLYHKADILLRFMKEVQSPQTLTDLLHYKIYPEVLPELRMPIFGLAYIFAASEEYHTTLQSAAIHEHDEMVKDPKNAAATFPEIKSEATTKLTTKLKVINKEFGTSFTAYDIQSRLYSGV